MSKTAEMIRTELDQFEPGPTEPHSMARLYEILEGFKELPDRAILVPSLFAVLERFPDAELGTPGPIVHALEAIAPFSKQLAESLMRQPTPSTVHMVSRILNSTSKPSERAFWIAQLKRVQTHVRSPSAAKLDAREILERHAA